MRLDVVFANVIKPRGWEPFQFPTKNGTLSDLTAFIATALHELLPENRRKVLAFADSRQEAAFFAWYAEESYKKLRDRNLMLRAINAGPVDEEGLSIDDLRNRLLRQWEQAGLFSKADTREQRDRQVLTSILREAVTDEKRLLPERGWLSQVVSSLRISRI